MKKKTDIQILCIEDIIEYLKLEEFEQKGLHIVESEETTLKRHSEQMKKDVDALVEWTNNDYKSP